MLKLFSSDAEFEYAANDWIWEYSKSSVGDSAVSMMLPFLPVGEAAGRPRSTSMYEQWLATLSARGLVPMVSPIVMLLPFLVLELGLMESDLSIRVAETSIALFLP